MLIIECKNLKISVPYGFYNSNAKEFAKEKEFVREKCSGECFSPWSIDMKTEIWRVGIDFAHFSHTSSNIINTIRPRWRRCMKFLTPAAGCGK